jgi:NTP pyrophosphatase (non-canonical NTP hydrolase)
MALDLEKLSKELDDQLAKETPESLRKWLDEKEKASPPMPEKCCGSLELLRDANILREKEWDPESKISVLFHGNELAGEVGEACNIIKKLERERMGIRGTRATVAELAEELADVVIVADLIALHSGIDLGQAVIGKFNATSKKYGLSVVIPRSPQEREGK